MSLPVFHDCVQCSNPLSILILQKPLCALCGLARDLVRLESVICVAPTRYGNSVRLESLTYVLLGALCASARNNLLGTAS